MSSSGATQTADELGYYACDSADEIYHKDAWVLLAAAAGPTARIRLGPCVARLSGLGHRTSSVPGRSAPVGAGLELLDHEPPDRFAQLLVVLGEDEVPALRGKVGLVHPAVAIVVSGSDAAGGGVRKLPERLLKVNSRTSYFLLIRPPLGAVGRSAQPPPSSRIAALRGRERGRHSPRRGAHLDPRAGASPPAPTSAASPPTRGWFASTSAPSASRSCSGCSASSPRVGPKGRCRSRVSGHSKQ